MNSDISNIDSIDLIKFMAEKGYRSRIHHAGIALDDFGFGRTGAKINLGTSTIEFTNNGEHPGLIGGFFGSIITSRVFFDPSEQNITFRSLVITPCAFPISYIGVDETWQSMPVTEFMKKLQSAFDADASPARPIAKLGQLISGLFRNTKPKI